MDIILFFLSKSKPDKLQFARWVRLSNAGQQCVNITWLWRHRTTYFIFFQVKSWCNVKYRRLDFAIYPPHVKDLKTYTWKPLIIMVCYRDHSGYRPGQCQKAFYVCDWARSQPMAEDVTFATPSLIGWDFAQPYIEDAYRSIQHFTKIIMHYNDVIMGSMASQITSLTIVFSVVYSGADQRKLQISASLTGEFPAQMASNAEHVSFDDVIMS